MRKSEVNSSQVAARVNDSQCGSDINNGYEPADFDSLAEKSERILLEAFLPFLEERIAFKMPSELRHLDGVLDYLNERMLRLGIINDDDSEVLVALDEAIVNAIKHGNKLDEEKRVFVVFTLEPRTFDVSVRDEVKGFDPGLVGDPLAEENLLKADGRGIFFMRSFMDDVSYSFPPAGGTVVHMRKRLGVPTS